MGPPLGCTLRSIPAKEIALPSAQREFRRAPRVASRVAPLRRLEQELLRRWPVQDILNSLRCELFAVAREGAFSVQLLGNHVAADA